MQTGFELGKLRQILRRLRLEAAVISSVPNIRYCSGIVIETQDCIPLRLAMLVVPVDDEPVFIAAETREALAWQAPDWLEDIRCYREFDRSPIQVLSKVLSEKNLDSGTLRVEKDHLVARFWEDLQDNCPKATYHDVGPTLDGLRMIKTPAEVESLRKAFVQTVGAIGDAFLATRVGDTEIRVAERIRQALVKRGATRLEFIIVVIEERSAWAHPPPSQRALAPGEILRVDVGAAFGHYLADVGRTAAAKSWPPEIRQAFDALERIREKVIPTLRPGLAVEEIHSRITGLYPRYNLPTPPIHTLLIGHGLGIELHEPPIICPGIKTRLTPGMVLNIEPDARPNGRCLAHENAYLVTHQGVEQLAPLPQDSPLVIDP